MPGKGKSARRSRKAGAKKGSMRTSETKKSKRSSGRPPAIRQKNIKEMRAILLERLDVLQGGMEQAFGSYQDIGATAGKGARGDVSDLAADALDGDTALQLAESGSTEISQIGNALAKIEEGSYGKCELCGEDIPWSRLEAVPYATTCIECKRKQEITGASGTNASGWSAVDELSSLEE